MRKGNLMSVRHDIRLLDATSRDGGLCNNFEFSDEFVRELYKANIKCGVDYMEFGYRASRNLFNEDEHGKWNFCKEEDIRNIVGDNASDMKIAVMADVGRCDYKTDFIPKKDSVIDMVRVACYIHQIPSAVEMINYFNELGYETTCNIMAISQASFNQIEDALEMLCESKADVIFPSIFSIMTYRRSSFYRTLLYCTSKILHFCKLNVCGNSTLSRSRGTVCPLFTLCLCHIFLVLTIFQTFSLLSYLLY